MTQWVGGFADRDGGLSIETEPFADWDDAVDFVLQQLVEDERGGTGLIEDDHRWYASGARSFQCLKEPGRLEIQVLGRRYYVREAGLERHAQARGGGGIGL